MGCTPVDTDLSWWRYRLVNSLSAAPGAETGRDDDEHPRKTIAIAANIAMARTEINRVQFQAFVSASGYVTSAEATPFEVAKFMIEGGFGEKISIGTIRAFHKLTWTRWLVSAGKMHSLTRAG